MITLAWWGPVDWRAEFLLWSIGLVAVSVMALVGSIAVFLLDRIYCRRRTPRRLPWILEGLSFLMIAPATVILGNFSLLAGVFMATALTAVLIARPLAWVARRPRLAWSLLAVFAGLHIALAAGHFVLCEYPLERDSELHYWLNCSIGISFVPFVCAFTACLVQAELRIWRHSNRPKPDRERIIENP